MIYLIEPYNAYQKPPKKKHWMEIVEEEALLRRIALEEDARTKIIQDAQRQEAIRQHLTERDAAANSNLNNQNVALPQYAPQPASQQVQNGQFAAPAGGGGWVVPSLAETTEVAAFTVTLSNIYGPVSVSFTNLTNTPGNDTFLWIFGSGSLTSANASPSPVVYDPGLYTVTLQATSSAGNKSTATQTFTVQTPSLNPRFSVITESNVAPSTASFTNTSYPNISLYDILTYNWVFGDGTTTASASPSPHVYNTGSFTVRLDSTSSYYPNITASFNLVGGITESLPQLNPRFSVTTSSNVAPLTASFTPTSFPSISPNEFITVRWVFGDGITTSSVNPGAHIYQTGSFPVRLESTGTFYGVTASFIYPGGITASVPIVTPSFTIIVDPVNFSAPSTVSFNNYTTTTANEGVLGLIYLWSLGTSSFTTTSFVPANTVYLNPGGYTASLQVTESIYNITASAKVTFSLT